MGKSAKQDEAPSYTEGIRGVNAAGTWWERARSYPIRPTRRAHDAIFKVMGEADRGDVWAVDMDLEKFLDTVNHRRLIRKLSTRIKDGRVLSLISRMLKSGVSVNGKVQEPDVGLMQGGPLSPLLANIYLDELDKELEKRGHRFARVGGHQKLTRFGRQS